MSGSESGGKMMGSSVGVRARQELARRTMAAKFFVDQEDPTLGFAPYVCPGWPVGAAHLSLLGWHLDEVRRYVETEGVEGIGRLMVWMPPRHWKSTSASVLFPIYMLGNDPDLRVIITSYNANLAKGFSRRARNFMGDVKYRAVFGDRAGGPNVVRLADDSKSAEEWNLDGHAGGVKAAGLPRGGITGGGADILIVDDPHKDRQEAESKAIRESIWDWWKSTAYTRLEKNGAAIIIQTRWHPQDLSGKLLQAQVEDPDADQWTVLCLPAFAEEWGGDEVEAEVEVEALKRGWWKGRDALGRWPGEPLWPQDFGRKRLGRIRGNVGSYEWDALYMQRPQRLEGGLIKAYDIIQVREHEVPQEMTADVRYWDLAVSGSDRADYIVGARLGRTRDRRTYIRHVARFKGPWADARPKMIKRMLADPPTVRQGIEVGGQQQGYYQEMTRDPKLQGRVIVPVQPRGSKEARASLWATRIQDGLIYLVMDGGFETDIFLSELVGFPNVTYDDQVDGVSGGWQMLGGGGGVATSHQG